jgi:16S rRNA processing protein RimM
METVVVGKVRTSHGVRGFLKVKCLSGETGHLLKLKELVLRKEGKDRRFAVESLRTAGPEDLILKLEGIESPEEGKRWSGADVVVPAENAAELREDEYYFSDLIGCRLMAGDKAAGTVESIVENGISELLEVATDSGKKIIPFQKRFIGRVDVKEGTIELLVPELLD